MFREQPMTLSIDLDNLMIEARSLVKAWRLAMDPLPADIAFVSGVYRDKIYVMRTERFRGPYHEAVIYATISDLEGNRRSVTVIGHPRKGISLPILGVDVIAFGDCVNLLAVDLAPTDPSFWIRHAMEPLRNLATDLEQLIKVRKRPDFTRGTFSEVAIIGAVKEPNITPALRRVEGFLDRVGELPTETLADADHAERVYQRSITWRESELRNAKEFNALAGMFGAEFAETYLREYVFPTA